MKNNVTQNSNVILRKGNFCNFDLTIALNLKFPSAATASWKENAWNCCEIKPASRNVEDSPHGFVRADSELY